MIIGKKHFATENNYYIMGILNLTPDSFYDGGKYLNQKQMLQHVKQMIDDGADIIDVGGESTRPNHLKVSAKEEIKRILKPLQLIKQNFDILISLDTTKSEVVEAVWPYIDLVNDISGLKNDPQMAHTIHKYNLACCLMHYRDNSKYTDFTAELFSDIQESIKLAIAANIDQEKIMIDAGVGFVKNYEQNLLALQLTKQLKQLNYPILIATSNKSMIGYATNSPLKERLAGTIATTVYGALNQATFFRVHDVKQNKQALQMIQELQKTTLGGQ